MGCNGRRRDVRPAAEDRDPSRRVMVAAPPPGDDREVNFDSDKLRYYSSLTANVHYFINRAAGVCYIRHIMHHGRYITGGHAR